MKAYVMFSVNREYDVPEEIVEKGSGAIYDWISEQYPNDYDDMEVEFDA